jgi:hypothetical protein
LLDDISGDADGHIVGRRFGERVYFVRIYEKYFRHDGSVYSKEQQRQ